MAQELVGKPIATAMREEILHQSRAYQQRGINPKIAVISVGHDAAARAYVASLKRVAEKLEITFADVHLDPDTAKVHKRVAALAADEHVHGIILALPFAKTIDAAAVYAQVPTDKDIDGLGAGQFGRLSAGEEEGVLAPATPQACLALVEPIMSLKGADTVILGRGKTVGRGLAAMLLNRHATVSVCHSATKNLADVTRRADVIFSAAGNPGLLTRDHVRAGQIVIDAGVSIVDGALCGDADFPAVAEVVSAITPSPGGVGPVTMAFVFANLMKAVQIGAES
ncbi:MAG: bifunctional 5,10-methylenetetrahydrofolate dehydrogenase/5,10-methenyltetrahydrofolate cyclohydrolase [Pseudomonadota bacterium]